jgi:hypothetical protein
MKSINQQYLTYVLGSFIKEAECFFETDFSNVKITVGHVPDLFGVAAFTFGNEIYLSTDVLHISNDDLYELLIHELTHVVQQKSGRVPHIISWNDCPGSDDMVLEREAFLMSRRFMAGQKCLMPNVINPAKYQPVIQRIVSIEGIPLNSINTLSTKTRNILSLITDGISWLNWAISTPNCLYPFPDESELLSGVQAGINGKPLLLLKNTSVMVTPAKLLELEVNDLKKIYDYENSDKSGSNKEIESQISQILSKNNLYSQKDIIKATGSLARLEVNDAPLFQALDLREKIDLVKMFNSISQIDPDQILLNNAAKFAIQYAKTPLAFSDYLIFYLTIIQKSKLNSETFIQQNNAVKVFLDAITPFLFGMLRCPRVDRKLDPDQLMQTLQSWINYENQVGFSRLSTGVLQTALNINPDNSANYRDEINKYMAKAQIFIKNYKPDAVNDSQDGQVTYYHYESFGTDAVLSLSLSGNITLKSYAIKS